MSMPGSSQSSLPPRTSTPMSPTGERLQNLARKRSLASRASFKSARSTFAGDDEESFSRQSPRFQNLLRGISEATESGSNSLHSNEDAKRLRDENARLSEEHEKLLSSITERDQKIHQQQIEISKLLEASAGKVDGDSVESMEQELRALRERLAKQTMDKKASAGKDNPVEKRLKKEILFLQKRLDTATQDEEARRSNLIEEHQQAKVRLAEAERHARDMVEKTSEAKKQLAELQENSGQLAMERARVSSLEEELNRLRAENARLTGFERKASDMDKMEQSKAGLELNMKRLQVENDTLKCEGAVLTQKNANMQEQIDLISRERDALAASMGQLSSTASNSEKLGAENGLLYAERTRLQKLRSELSEKLHAAEEALAERTAALENTAQRLGAAQEELGDLQDNYRAACDQIETLSIDYANAASENSRLNGEVLRLCGELAKTENLAKFVFKRVKSKISKPKGSRGASPAPSLYGQSLDSSSIIADSSRLELPL